MAPPAVGSLQRGREPACVTFAQGTAQQRGLCGRPSAQDSDRSAKPGGYPRRTDTREAPVSGGGGFILGRGAGLAQPSSEERHPERHEAEHNENQGD